MKPFDSVGATRICNQKLWSDSFHITRQRAVLPVEKFLLIIFQKMYFFSASGAGRSGAKVMACTSLTIVIG
jgi:hypothetical protein